MGPKTKYLVQIFRYEARLNIVMSKSASCRQGNLYRETISTPNLSGTILMYMCRSLLIFSNVNFKMAARQPYWIFGFRTLTLVWLWISTAILSGSILIYMGRSLSIFSDVTFLVSGRTLLWLFLLWLWISAPNFSGKVLMYMGKSQLIFSDLIF